MAGIFANIDSDIDKLRKLKSEIDNVKKALQKINVKVDIDIAQDLEARLKGLMTQYDALAQKVAQTDAKIAESTARINKSAETVVKAQEQMAKAASGQGTANTQGVSGGNEAATNAQTASVEAQAKAYDELAAEIDAVMGTRSRNIKRMMEEQNAIRLINEEIKRMTKYQGQNSTLSASQQNRLAQLNDSLMQHKTALSELRQNLNNSFKLDNAAATSMNALSQSLARMRMTYRKLTEEERKSPFGQELLSSIQQADAKIKQLDATIGNHQRNVGNYASGWNGLNVSIQQIGRELPSLAMGWNTFFLAISNNLPILADEIKRAKNEYNNLKKAGQQATPVWKQVVSSLLSWQTALTVGITLLTMYGKDIIEWAKNALVGESAAEKLKKQLLELNEIEKDAHATQIRTRAELDNVISSIKNFNGTREQEKQKIDELNSKYGSIFGSYNSLAKWYDILISKGDDYINSLFAQAKAQSYIQKAIEADQKIRDIKANGVEEYRPLLGRGGRIYQFFGGGNTNLGSDPAKLAYDKALKQAEEERDDFLENAEQLQKQYLQGIKKAGIFDYRTLFNKDKNAEVSNLKSYLDELSKLQEDNEDRQIDLMEEGTEKQLAEIDLRYQRIRDKVKELENNLRQQQGGELTAEQQTTFGVAYSGINDMQNRDERNVWQSRVQSEMKSWNEYLQKYGDYEQKRFAITQEYDQKIANSSNIWEKASLGEEKKKSLEQLDEQYGKSTRAMADLFEDASEKSVSSIQKIIDKYELLVKYLSGTKQSDGTEVTMDELKGVGFTDRDIEKIEKGEISIKDVTDALKGLKEELKGKSPWQSFVSDIQKGIDKLKSAEGDTQKVGEGITEIGNAVTSFAPVLGDFANNIASIFGADDTNITEIANVIGGLGQTAAGVGQIMSGDVVGGVMSAVSGISSIVSALEGAFGADYSEYNAMKERYDTLINVWDELIDKKMEYIDIDYGVEAQKAADEAARLVETQIQRQRQLANMLAGSGASVGSHSMEYRVDSRMSKESWDELSKLIGQRVGSLQDVINLDADVIGKVLGSEDFVNVLTTVNSDFIEYIQNISDYADQLDEIAQKEKEAITGIGFDSFRDGYVDMLSDLDSTNEDFADNFEKYLQNAVLYSLVANKYKQRIQDLYDSWAEMGDDGLSSIEAESLRKQNEQLVEELLADRDKLMQDFGWDTDAQKQQSASKGGYDTMTQDQATEMSGRLTALCESSMRQETIQQGIYNIADETRNIIAQSYLELQQISENTGEIIKPIKQMQLDMAEVKRNTSRL